MRDLELHLLRQLERSPEILATHGLHERLNVGADCYQRMEPEGHWKVRAKAATAHRQIAT